MKNVFITAGHSVIKGKGTGANGFMDEAVEAELLANELAVLLQNSACKVYRDPKELPLSGVVAWVRRLIKKDDILIDIHFNAGPPTATGTEVFIPKNYTRLEFDMAVELSSVISTTLGIKKRQGKLFTAGVKTENESQHTTLAMLGGLGIGTNVLLEICFVTNHEDYLKYKKEYPSLISNLAFAIKKFI